MAPFRWGSLLALLPFLAGTVICLGFPADARCADAVAEVFVEKARVRSGPGMEHPIVTTLTKGEKAPVISTAGEWCHIALPGGKEGWVFRKLVTIRDSEGEQASSKTAPGGLENAGKGESPGAAVGRAESEGKRETPGTALERVKTGFGQGVGTVLATGRSVLGIGESQSTTGARMLDDVEEEDLKLQKQGTLKVDYAAVDRMDAALPPPRGEFEAFLSAGKLAPEKRP